MRSELQAIKMHVYEDGVIDQSEVKMLRGIVDAEKPGEEEVRLLLDLNTVLSGGDMDPAFAELLVDATVKFVLDDDGGVPDEKMAWLEANISKDGKTDANEVLILRAIEAKAGGLPDRLAALLG
ncbi:MAG: hypothetical protein KAH11_08985 [Rhodospirillales bacterium]|nr:hypothetical protein [Rhodospirillales bacterium]